MGQVVEGSADSAGRCLSSEAKVNFIVPSIKCLETQNLEEAKPGIMQQCIETLSQTSSTVKISFDSKKINSSLSDRHGDEDLFNNEQTPTLKETKLRLDTEIKTVDGLQEKLENGYLSCSDLHLAINIISCRIRDLRQMAVLKTGGFQEAVECLRQILHLQQATPRRQLIFCF